MSRSGYTDDCDGWALICWRGAVRSAIKGKRGQTFLKELLATLDAMPSKRLIANELIDADEVCTLGAIGKQRGIALETFDPYESETIASTFGIAEALAREIMFENDEGTYGKETPDQRWQRMRKWVADQVIS